MPPPDPADNNQALAGHPPASGVPRYPLANGDDAPPPHAYAFWGRRVLASLVDALAVLPLIGMSVATTSTVQTTYEYFATKIGDQPVSITRSSGATTTSAAFWPLLIITLVVAVATLVFEIWNLIVRQGRTGSSLGKQLLGIMVISEMTGTPIGAGRTLARQLTHILDGLCLVGYLWPLWDPKRQTFADKVANTIVVPRTARSRVGLRHRRI